MKYIYFISYEAVLEDEHGTIGSIRANIEMPYPHISSIEDIKYLEDTLSKLLIEKYSKSTTKVIYVTILYYKRFGDDIIVN